MTERDRVLTLLVLAGMLTQSLAQADDTYKSQRERMVRDHIASAGIKRPRVLQSMRDTPRHEFLAPDQRDLAYYDMAVPIGHGQTISPPYIVAFMTAQLDPQPSDRVLEIGTGSGYQAAVLSPLVKQVYTIEIVEPLGQQAAETLRRLGYDNVFCKTGDGYAGWPEHAPFDKIIVTCSPENVPQPLIEQLAEGGQIIVPVGERFQQTLCRFKKINGELIREPLQATFFVPMTGESEALRNIKPDLTRPGLVNGGFEELLADTSAPAGWYYLREARVRKLSSAPAGERVLTFDNQVVGRSAHALQAFGIDGSTVHELQVELSIAGQRIRPGGQQQQAAQALLEFYDANRSPIGQTTLGPWSGSFNWRHVSERVAVPAAAQLGVIGVGLFGATGQLSVDSVSIATPTTQSEDQAP